LIINITSKNIAGFHRLRESINASPVQQVLFISSSSVYQNLSREVTEDEGAENSDSLLFQIENLFRNQAKFETTILRFSGLIGAGRHPGRFFAHGKQVQQASAPVNLIHIADCIGIIDAIIHQAAWNTTFNGCADSHPSKKEFYSHARQLLGMPPPLFAATESPAFKIVSNQKIKQQLQYQLQYPDLMALKSAHYEN
jgi:nucleoside-diphosphate-sugar epimerase